MSDSDDTDILLLIPPDFFISSAEEKLRKQKEHRKQRELEATNFCFTQSQDFLNETIANALRDFNYEDWESINNSMDSISESAAAADVLSMPPPTAAYKFLPTRQKAELNDINARLATFEQDRFAAPSDISTISNCTVRNHFGHNYKPQLNRMVGITHSTPKSQQIYKEKVYGDGNGARVEDKGVLHEIDNFLDDRNYGAHWNPASNNDGNHHSDDYRYCQEMEPPQPKTKHASSLPTALNRLSLERKFSNDEKKHMMQSNPIDNDNLISLSDIWGKNGQGNLAAATPNLNLKEEQLRRQHLERTVRTLQSRLLEYQQRLSVAIEVDRTKDAALTNVQAEKKSLSQELYQLRDSVSKLESEQLEHNKKLDAMQCELAQAVNLASKFQEKNDKLEIELDNCRRNSVETKKQIEEFELKMHAAKTSEEFAINELNKLRDKLAKAEHCTEKLKMRCENLEKDNSTLKHQKELLQEYHQKQKNRADSLETHRKSLQDAIGNLTETESALKKKLETQQKTLKTHYQQQLEYVVAQKLKEFQEQLDKMEENLRSEAHERERLIAERAVKQLELMIEKNELELNLLQEKHNEEVELYRIQLANASKKIDGLELKLNAFKSKRADIAEKLHDVMETQWQKALEILTSPNQSSKTVCTSMDAGSPECNEHQGKDCDGNRTPKSSKNTNNLNIEETTPPEMDKLQAYIELLLSKSPSDFDKLDEILMLSAKSKSVAGKSGKTSKRTNVGKPPWKA